MDSDLKEFIRQEQVKLSNIQSGLSTQQRNKLLPKINQIRFLLRLLANEGSVISDKDKKDLEDKIDDATKSAEKTAKAEQVREASNVSLINRIRPNTDTIPEMTRQKAVMVRASSLFDSNGGDAQSVNDYLENEGVDYKVSEKVGSTGESLVLENKFDPTDVKVAFRGSKMNNLQDWISNAKIAVGQEQRSFIGEKDTIGEARAKVQEVESIYGNKANELLGHSRGGAMALNVGDAEGINTTTFNAYIGRNLARASETAAQHTAWRTTEDMPSIGLGFRQNLKNFKINVIRPAKDSLNPIDSHKLKNFTEKKPPALSDNPELIENLIKTNINEPVAKHAEAENIHRAISFKDGQGRILQSRDPYNTNAKARKASGGIGHNVNDPSNYQIGEQILALPAPPPNQSPAVRAKQKFLSNASKFNKQNVLNKITNFDQAEKFLEDFNQDGSEKNPLTERLQKPKTTPVSDTDLKTKLQAKQNVKESIKSTTPPKEKFSAGLFPPKPDKVPNTLDNQLRQAQKEYEGYLQRYNKEQTSTELYYKNMPERDKLRKSVVDEAQNKLMRLRQQRTAQRQTEREPSFKDWVAEVKPNDIGSDGKLSSNITKNSKVANIWRKIGGKFTDDELDHLNSNPTPDNEKHTFSLEDDEIADLASENTQEGRHKIVKDYEQKVHDGIKNVDEAVSIEDGAGGKRTITGELTGGLNAVNLGIGLGAAYTTDKFLNKIDPNLDPTLKTGISGAISGGIGEAAALTLSGAGAGIAASGGLLLAPAVVAGAAGNIAGMGAYKGIKKIGGSDFEATTWAGAAGGLAAGMTAGGLMAALSAGGVAGAAAAAPADLETFGLASVGAGLLGAGIGATSYIGTEEFSAIEDKIKKNTGATDLEADLGAGAGTGATIGGIAGTFIGGPVGTVIGAGVGGTIGGIAALAKYGIDKLF